AGNRPRRTRCPRPRRDQSPISPAISGVGTPLPCCHGCALLQPSHFIRTRSGGRNRGQPGRTAEQRTHLGGGPMTVANRRRGADRRTKDVPVNIERRSGLDRRLIVESATAQIHAVLELLTELADQGALRDDSRRLLDTAMLRLRYALERIESE